MADLSFYPVTFGDWHNLRTSKANVHPVETRHVNKHAASADAVKGPALGESAARAVLYPASPHMARISPQGHSLIHQDGGVEQLKIPLKPSNRKESVLVRPTTAVNEAQVEQDSRQDITMPRYCGNRDEKRAMMPYAVDTVSVQRPRGHHDIRNHAAEKLQVSPDITNKSTIYKDRMITMSPNDFHYDGNGPTADMFGFRDIPAERNRSQFDRETTANACQLVPSTSQNIQLAPAHYEEYYVPLSDGNSGREMPLSYGRVENHPRPQHTKERSQESLTDYVERVEKEILGRSFRDSFRRAHKEISEFRSAHMERPSEAASLFKEASRPYTAKPSAAYSPYHTQVGMESLRLRPAESRRSTTETFWGPHTHGYSKHG